MSKFIIFFFLNSLCTLAYSQQASWFVGMWKGSHPMGKGKQSQSLDISLNITIANDNNFEGVIKLMLPADTSVHLDIKVIGEVHPNYLSATLSQIVYKKDPPGTKWETRCNTCGSRQFLYSAKDGKFILTGETSGCLPSCNGITVYYRNFNDFDTSSLASLKTLINDKENIVSVKDTVPEKPFATKTPPKDTLLAIKIKPTQIIPEKKDSQVAKNEVIKIQDSLKENPVVVKNQPKRDSVVAQKIKPAVVVSAPKNDTVFSQKKIIKIQDTIKEKPLVVKPQPKKDTIVAQKIKPAVVVTLPKNDTVIIQKKIVKIQDSIKEKPLVIAKTTSEKDTVVAQKIKSGPAVLPEVAKKDSMVSEKVETYEKRTANLVKIYPVSTDSVIIKFYDDGVVDEDTISVFNNGQLLVGRLGLTSSGYEIKIPINKTVDNNIVLYAHNLGLYPPNTALLYIYSGKTRYNISISSDLHISSSIILRYIKP